jgi:predicted AlkP superfamily phosphohydrolase/phosphomutase
MTTSTRTFVLGLDSATWDLLDPWMAQGLLPNLAALRARGAWGTLQSTIQPITSAAWPTLLTGKQQGKHSIYDFVRRRQGSYAVEMTNASMIASPTLYDLLSAAGRSVASINMPYTFPPRPVNGVVVGGLFATVTGPALTYPPSAWEEITQVAPEYCIAPDYDASAADPLQRYIDDMHSSIEQRTRVAEHFLAKQDWDLFVLVYTEPDEIQHAFWHCLEGEELPPAFADHPQRFGNPILAVYQQIDAALPRLLALMGPDANVWVVSDHGAGQLRYMVYLNPILAQHGLLRFKQRAGHGSRLQRLARLYKRSLPNGVRAGLRRMLGDDAFQVIKGELETRSFASAIDWQHTRAYALGSWGNIFVNLAGREPQGTVQPGAEYEQVCREVSELFLSLRHPETGAPAVARVHRREELYSGAALEQAPDLIVLWADQTVCGRGGYEGLSHEVFERRWTADFSELPLTGFHRQNGIYMAAGPAVSARGPAAEASLVDIAPSILSQMGLATPQDMDGRAIGLQELHAAPAQAPLGELAWEGDSYRYSDEEEAMIQKRLEDLGYL